MAKDANVSPDEHAAMYVEMAGIHMDQGRYETALAKVHRAIEINPRYAIAYSVLGLVYNRLHDRAKAEENFKKALELAPDDPGVLNNYGQFLCQVGRATEAEPMFDKAMNNPLYETPETAQINAGYCAYREGDLEKAETYFRKALTINATLPAPLLEMAEISFQRERHLPARGYLQRYASVAEHTPRSLWLGIQIERKLGDKDAVASYSTLLKGKFPDTEETRKLLESESHP
jgi:type IV pilus assembly protein PilF